MENDCQICTEPLNKSTHKPLKCKYCDFSSCIVCQKAFILNSEISHCMSCNKNWDKDYINSIFPKTFIGGDMRKHRENLNHVKEMSYMEETQLVFEYRRISQKAREKYKEKELEIINLKREMDDLSITINHPQTAVDIDDDVVDSNDIIIKGIPCPKEECVGIMVRWKCRVCTYKMCSRCRETKEDNHECDQNILDSVNLAKADSKPCPECGTAISKEGGCNEMFCVSCNVSFSWATGKKLKGGHNPHLVDYIRRMRGEGGNVRNENIEIDACANMVSIYSLPPTEKNYNGYNNYRNNHRFNNVDTTVYEKSGVDILNDLMYAGCRLYNEITGLLQTTLSSKTDYKVNEKNRLNYLEKIITVGEMDRLNLINKNRNDYRKELETFISATLEQVKILYLEEQSKYNASSIGGKVTKVHSIARENSTNVSVKGKKKHTPVVEEVQTRNWYAEDFAYKMENMRTCFNTSVYELTTRYGYKSCYMITDKWETFATNSTLARRETIKNGGTPKPRKTRYAYDDESDEDIISRASTPASEVSEAGPSDHR